VSQALTLFTTPVVYLYLDRLSNWLTGAAPAETEAAEAPGKDGLAPQPLAAE